MKKFLSLILSTMIVCSFATTSVFAENSSSTQDDSYIEARYSDFSMLYATLYKNSQGFYDIAGGAGTYSNQKWLEVTVTLEACGYDGKYHPVDGFEWTDADYSAVATFATRDLPGGGYRVHTVAKCYLNGTLLETAEAYSSVVNVPY